MWLQSGTTVNGVLGMLQVECDEKLGCRNQVNAYTVSNGECETGRLIERGQAL